MPRSWNRNAIKRGSKIRLAANENWHVMAERRRRNGLTTRGTIPKRKPNVRISYERLERITSGLLLIRVNSLAAAIAKHFDLLPDPAKAAALELEIELAAMRKELL